MVKTIISTVFARALLAALNFILAVITTQYLGPEGKGDVSLFVLNLTIVQLINNFVGGPYLVYLVPRKNFMQLLFLSYLWSGLTAIFIPVLLLAFNLLETNVLFHLMIIAGVLSFSSINLFLMQGKERINPYNITSVFQTIILLIGFIIYLEWFEEKSLLSFIKAMYFSTSLGLILGFVFLAKHLEKISFKKNLYETFSDTLKKGCVLQTGAIAQMLNYRLSFYLLDKLYEEGRKSVGIYSVAVSATEGVWLLSQSVSIVLYSKISNSENPLYAQKLIVSSIKIIFMLTLICTGILLLLPSSFFAYIFGAGFEQVKTVLFYLSIGIIIFSIGIILSAYFVGTGKARISVTASVIGLAVTVISGTILVPQYGLAGAGITASASYTAGVIYQLILFIREAKEIQIRDFILSKSDILLMIAEMKNYISRKR